MEWIGIVKGHLRSLKIAPFDRGHMSYYSHFIVTMSYLAPFLPHDAKLVRYMLLSCPSVRPSQAGTVPKQLSTGSRRQCQM